MEHVITKHILNHLESNSLLYDLQHGFRHSRSTDLIIMDFAKAFDKVPHQRLLCKLKFYGIKNQTLNWFDSFVDDAVVGEQSELAGFHIF
jgi:hypothetical protein